jgi:hypothetical protein
LLLAQEGDFATTDFNHFQSKERGEAGVREGEVERVKREIERTREIERERETDRDRERQRDEEMLPGHFSHLLWAAWS